MSKGEEAKNTLASQIANKDANIKVMHLDMDDYHSVAPLAAAVKSDFPALNLLILNAGIACLKHGYGPSG